MASVNKVILIGHLGAAPEMRYLPSGDAVANLRIATSETWKDRDGNKQEATEWHKVAFFGKIAEVCGQYLKKGSQVYIEGSLRTRKWQDEAGNDRYSTEIRGDVMRMLGGGGGQQRRDDAGDSSASDYARASGRQAPAGGMPDDDIPFMQPFHGGIWRVV